MSSSRIRRARGGSDPSTGRAARQPTAPTPETEIAPSNSDELEALTAAGPAVEPAGVLQDPSLAAAGDTSWANPEAATATAEATPTTSPELQATSPELQAAIDSWMAAVPEGQREEAQANLPSIVRACAEAGVTDPDQVSYILATAQHESGFGEEKYSRSVSLVEDHNPFTQNADGSWSSRNHVTGNTSTAATQEELEVQYWNDAYGSRTDLGNRADTDDGADYRGRGFVQLTGRSNYSSMTTILGEEGYTYTVDGVTYGTEQNPIDLLAHPDHVNQVPDLAARILVEGSIRGTFTGKSLSDYINDDETDFVDARRVINGTDRAEDVAAIAETYQGATGDWAAAVAGGSTTTTTPAPTTAPPAPVTAPTAPVTTPTAPVTTPEVAPSQEPQRRPFARRRRG